MILCCNVWLGSEDVTLDVTFLYLDFSTKKSEYEKMQPSEILVCSYIWLNGNGSKLFVIELKDIT